MSIRRFFYTLSVLLFAVSCTGSPEYKSMYKATFVNATNYNVEICDSRFKDLPLLAKTEVSAIFPDGIIVGGGLFQDDKVIFMYNDVLKVEYHWSDDVYHNPCKEDSYIQLNDSEYTKHYYYVITDADYQFALEHGTMIE